MAPKTRSLIVIGCGGIWSYLWKPLCRMLSYTKDAPRRLVLVDGDQFTVSNLERQDMVHQDLMRNKADVYSERIRVDFPDIRVNIVPEFVTAKNIGIIEDGAIIVSAVDNHATRKLIADHARMLKDCVVVTGASDMVSGNVHLHIVRGGKEVTEGIDKSHPEVAAGKDRNPGDMNCEERAKLPGGGQQIVSNVFTATIMVAVLWKLFSPEKGGEKGAKDIIDQSEIFYDVNHLAMDTTTRAIASRK